MLTGLIERLLGVKRGEFERRQREFIETMGNKYLIVGLGNAGRDYRGNRHNVGFMLVDLLAQQHNIPLTRVQNRAIVGFGQIGGEAAVLAKPQTMMNLSGDAIGPLANFYKIAPEQIIVAYDDLDLATGQLRLRKTGGAGGHNGMRSLINHLGKDFIRVRIGIGRPPGKMPAAAYVLQDFGRDEREIIDVTLAEAADAVITILRDGPDTAMNRHNQRTTTPGETQTKA